MPPGAGAQREGADAPAPETPVPAPLPGELLAARRQELNLSIEDVAMRVRLAPRQIVALEANDFATLPGTATVRGFVRSYAKLLGLDPEPLVALLAHEPNPPFEPVASRQPLPASGFRSRRYSPPVMHRAGARRLAGFAAVVLVFVGTLAVIAYRNDWLQAPPAETSPGPAEIEVGQGDTAPLQSSDTAPSSVPAPVSTPAPAAAGVPPQAVPPAAPPAVAPPVAVQSPASQPPSAQPPVALPSVSQQSAAAATAGDALQLRLREDAWIEVLAVNGGRKLFSKLAKAGSTELVAVNEPVVLVVGNAAGVEASLRGQALNLTAAARDNVARLSLK